MRCLSFVAGKQPFAKETAMSSSDKNPIALITGGSRGLGRSMALHLAERGVDILFTFRSGKAEAAEVQGRIAALGPKPAALPLDVPNRRSFHPLAPPVPRHLDRTS